MRSLLATIRRCRPTGAAPRRPVLALAVLAALPALSARPSAQHAAIEEHIQEAWRWRMLSVPEHRAPSFRTVRPWRDGGLIAVDDMGLAIFDGYEWTRPPGSQKFAVGEVIEIGPVADGAFLVCDGKLVALDESGNLVSLAEVPRPRELKPAFRRGDGSALVALGDTIVALTTVAAGARVVSGLPPGARTIHSVAEDAGGSLWAVTDAGLYR